MSDDAKTVSNRAKIKDGRVAQLKEYLTKWNIGSGEDNKLEGVIDVDIFYIKGYGGFMEVSKIDDPYDIEAETQEFMEGLASFLDEPLIIHSIIFDSDEEMAHYDIDAVEWQILPDGKVKKEGFKYQIEPIDGSVRLRS